MTESAPVQETAPVTSSKPKKEAPRMPSPKKKPSKKAAPPRAARGQKAPAKKPAVVGEKKDLIRSFPPSTPASVIIAAGAKKGLKLTPKYVYTTRSGDKSRPPREPRDRAPKKDAKLARVAREIVRAGESPAERAFRVACCAAMVGMDREDVERIAREVLGGFESAAKRRAS